MDEAWTENEKELRESIASLQREVAESQRADDGTSTSDSSQERPQDEPGDVRGDHEPFGGATASPRGAETQERGLQEHEEPPPLMEVMVQRFGSLIAPESYRAQKGRALSRPLSLWHRGSGRA